MRPILAIAAGLLVTALVATGVTLAILRIESRTNPQQVNLRPGITLSQDSAIVQAASKARPAVVSVVTQQQPTLIRGSGYLATSDGYIVTSINVIAGATALTVLIPGDSKTHDARLVDYDCETGVAVVKVGKVSAMHRVVSVKDPLNAAQTLNFSDTIQTSAAIDGGTTGGPLLNVQSQVVGVAMESPSSLTGFGLNVADIQDDVQQMLQSGQVAVSSLGATTTDVTAENA